MPDALPVAQPTVSKHWREVWNCKFGRKKNISPKRVKWHPHFPAETSKVNVTVTWAHWIYESPMHLNQQEVCIAVRFTNATVGFCQCSCTAKLMLGFSKVSKGRDFYNTMLTHTKGCIYLFLYYKVRTIVHNTYKNKKIKAYKPRQTTTG